MIAINLEEVKKEPDMFGVTILGNNSALPAFDRHPTSQLVTLNDQSFLIDCGEGAQMQMTKYKIKRSKINHIFISHLHGDHYFGLPGLLTTYGLLGRAQDLHLYAPPQLQNILSTIFSVGDTRLPFTLHFHPVYRPEMLIDDENFSVECFKVFHRVECFGFLIREKTKPRKIVKEKISSYNIPHSAFNAIKEGSDFTTSEGNIIRNEEITIANKSPRSYAFCADTAYKESLADILQHVSMMYHETTYLKVMEEKAASRFHSTTIQAAMLAKMSNAGRLLIGHFSSKYEFLEPFLQETIEVFPQTQLALEGATYVIE